MIHCNRQRGEEITRRSFLRLATSGTLAAASAVLLPGYLGIGLPTGIVSNSAQSTRLGTNREFHVTVDPWTTIGTNNLSLGFMLDQDDWRGFVNTSALRRLAHEANFRLVRLFDFKDGGPQPCTYWDEATSVGTFDWTNVDLVVRKILEIGAEPMFCLGGYSPAGPLIPPGMAVDPNTCLPTSRNFAAYASEWPKHFKAIGLPVRHYEIVNEAWAYFGRQPNLKRLESYMQLFNATAGSMRQQDPGVSLSFDWIAKKPVLEYWLENGGADVDSLNFHKYDGQIAEETTDQQMLVFADSRYFGTWPLEHTINEARQLWFSSRGKLLPVIDSETNFNSAWQNGTDPRIQQMVGAVWIALVLRMSIIRGVQHSVYYKLASSASYALRRPTGGLGFGMINSDTDRPWLPYYVHHMIGRNLSHGDSLVYAASSSNDIASLAWIHDGVLDILLVCKSAQQSSKTVTVYGIKDTQFNFFKIDNTVPWRDPHMQTGVTTADEGIDCCGYTVALMQAPLSYLDKPT